MNHNHRFAIYLIVLVISFMASLFRWRDLPVAMKYISGLLGLTVVSEITAYCLATIYRNNMPVYHVYTPVSLLLIIAFYSNILEGLRRNKIGIILSATCIAASVFNSLLLQNFRTLNSNFILFAGCVTIGLALWSFNQFYRDERLVNLIGYPYFQVSLALLFYWCSTFISWALHALLELSQLSGIYVFMWVVNIITYSGIACIFLFYKKEKLGDCKAQHI